MNEMLAKISSQTNRYALYPSQDEGGAWYVFDMNAWIAIGRTRPLFPPALEAPTTYALADARRLEMNARAVVEAMREPTPAMLKSAWKASTHGISAGIATTAWQAMIEEILK